MRAKEGTPYFKPSLTQAAFGFTAFALFASASAQAGLNFRSYQTHSHVAIPIDPQVSYKVEKVEKDGKLLGIRVTLDNVAQAEDGSGIRDLTDPRTQAVRVTRQAKGDGNTIIYDFALSKQAQVAGIEYFDYRSKAPQEIQIDYWLASQKMDSSTATAAAEPTEEKPVAAKPVAKVPTKKIAKVAKHNAVSPGKVHGTLAGTCPSLVRGRDAFIGYKIWHKPFDYRGFFKLRQADSAYEYKGVTVGANEKWGTRAKEIAHYRLAHKLFKKQQFALTLRTIDFFATTYPNSVLKDDAQFLKANTLIQLSRLLKTERYNEQAFEIFRQMILEKPLEERSKQALAYIVQEFMSTDKVVRSLEYSLMGTAGKGYDKDDLAPYVFRLAAAEALQQIGEFDRAERSYQSIIDGNNALTPEAAFRIGEVYAARKFWERAVIAYESAIKKYPKDVNRFASNWFNLAEAYYRMDRINDAVRVNTEFMKRFHNETVAWAANFRLAELEQVRLATPASAKTQAVKTQTSEKIEAGYSDVVNTHPYSAGAQLAFIRMASCHHGIQNDTKEEFFLKYFNERDLKKFESPILEPMEVEIALDLTEARFHLANSRFEDALKRVDSFRIKYSKLPLGPLFREVYEKASVELVRVMVEQGKGVEVLKTAEQYADVTPKPEPYGYLMALTEAAFNAGNLQYVSEKLPKLTAQLSTASSGEKDRYHLMRGRMMRLMGESVDAAIVEFSLISDNGPVSAFKLDELAEAALAQAAGKGDVKASENFDSILVRGDLYKKFPLEKQLDVHARHINSLSRLGRHEDVVRFSNQALLKFGARTEFGNKIFRIKEQRAEALYDSGDHKGSVEATAELLKAEPKPKDFHQTEFEFKQAQSLRKLGRDEEALKTFQKVAKSTVDDVWKKSAQAELDQLQWENSLPTQTDRRSKQ